MVSYQINVQNLTYRQSYPRIFEGSRPKALNLAKQSYNSQINNRQFLQIKAQKTEPQGVTSVESASKQALNRFGLIGKNALVTGGSKGIGREIVDEFVKLGAKVAICSRSKDGVDQVVDEYAKQGIKIWGFAQDLQDSQGVESMMSNVSQAFDGRLDILVNNVGGNFAYHETQDFSEEEYDLLMNMNVRSMFLATKFAFPLMKKSEAGSVVFISSICGGPQAMEKNTMYDMSKAAMNQFNRQVACDWAKYNIRSNTIAPWYIATELGIRDLQNDEYNKRVLKATPMRRIGLCEDVSGLSAFLSSDAAAWITGQTIYVDGGMMVKGFGYEDY